jgi:AcrR family transcriptional regulator
MTAPATLTARKRQATRDRIAAAAAQLVADGGLAGTTIESIAAAAEVGRATFFRYFSCKEDAVADGMTRHWLDAITAALSAQPPQLSARDAVVGAFHALGDGFGDISVQVRDLAAMTRSSPVLSAWTLQIYVNYESAIAPAGPPTRRSAPPADRRGGDGVRPDRARRLARARRVAPAAGAQRTGDDVGGTGLADPPGD